MKQWIEYEKDEVEKIITKLYKEGNNSSKIGIILRDQYGIPRVKELKLKINEIIEKNEKQEIPEDIYNLLKRAVELHRHMSTHKKDAKAKRGLELAESRIRRLGKYYVKKEKLPKGWVYSIEKAKLIVK